MPTRVKPKVYGYRQIARAATRWKIPVWVLVGVKIQESGTGSGLGATSRTGAQGPFQFEPGTAQTYHVNTSNFASSADGAAHLLHDLYHQFGGDWNKAIEAYNAGPGGVGHAEYGEAQVKKNAQAAGVNPNLVGKDFQLRPAFVHKLFLLGFGGETVAKIEQVLAANGEPARDYERRALHASVKQLEALVEETEKSPLQAAIESVAPANPVQGIADFFSLIVQPSFWLRVLEVIAGAILAYLGIKTLTGAELPSMPVGPGRLGPLKWSTPGLHP